MTDVLKPRDAKEVEEAVRYALGNDKPLELVGQGSKRRIGRPSQTDLTLDLSGLTGVTLYEPEELVLSARAGTPLAEIETLLEKNNQQLGFEPMDYGPVFGEKPGQGSIGGTIAANLSGPRRIKAGAARDHFLGVSAVTGRGETIKSGGRVVKNVTGYDLCKLFAGLLGHARRHDRRHRESVAQGRDRGHCGRLRPRRCSRGTGDVGCHGLILRRLRRRAFARSCGLVVCRPAQRRGRDGAAAGRLRALGCAPQGSACRVDEAIRAGHHPRRRRLARSSGATCARSNPSPWTPRATGRCGAFPPRRARATRSPTSSRRQRRCSTTGAAASSGWRCRLPMSPTPPPSAAPWRKSAATPRLIRAPAAVRAAVDVFEPEEAVVAALSKRVKEGFDPKGVLNPGRMWAGV